MGMNAQRQLKNDVVIRKLVSELSKCYPHHRDVRSPHNQVWDLQRAFVFRVKDGHHGDSRNIPIAAEEPKPRLEAVELARLVLSERVIPRKKNHLTGREG